jgi:hypothetical protein
MRWDIETFYRDFKHIMQATSWHCHTPTSFHQELLVHMITLCLIRIAMIEASHLATASVAQLSFARALAETRLFLKLLLSTPGVLMWSTLWTAFVHCCACHRVQFKPDRQFPRDRQEYRRKTRGLEKVPLGRKIKYNALAPQQPERETLKDSKGRIYLLS